MISDLKIRINTKTRTQDKKQKKLNARTRVNKVAAILFQFSVRLTANKTKTAATLGLGDNTAARAIITTASTRAGPQLRRAFSNACVLVIVMEEAKKKTKTLNNLNTRGGAS